MVTIVNKAILQVREKFSLTKFILTFSTVSKTLDILSLCYTEGWRIRTPKRKILKKNLENVHKWQQEPQFIWAAHYHPLSEQKRPKKVMQQSGGITTLYGAAYGPLEWKNKTWTRHVYMCFLLVISPGQAKQETTDQYFFKQQIN